MTGKTAEIKKENSLCGCKQQLGVNLLAIGGGLSWLVTVVAMFAFLMYLASELGRGGAGVWWGILLAPVWVSVYKFQEHAFSLFFQELSNDLQDC